MILRDTLLRWLPADSRIGVVQRATVVWGVALVIALFQWISRPDDHPLDRSLVYSYAISTAIWLLADPLRIVLRRWFSATGPHYWMPSWRTGLYLVLVVVVGYAAGTALGDAYSGRSTWELLISSPQRFWTFWLSTVVVSAGFVVYFSLRGKSEDLQRQAAEARLKLLETQLEPHMLFNTLANLRVLIQTDPPRAEAMLDHLVDYLRATLGASRSTEHALADEFARLRDYLEIMAVRMGPRLQYTLDLPEALRRVPVPPLLLQPLVENAIRHGLEPRREGGSIHVVAGCETQGETCRLVLEVQDTGVGLVAPAGAPPDSAPHQRFGLAQVRERLHTLHGSQGALELIAAGAYGVKARVTFPLKK